MKDKAIMLVFKDELNILFTYTGLIFPNYLLKSVQLSSMYSFWLILTHPASEFGGLCSQLKHCPSLPAVIKTSHQKQHEA